MKKMSLWILATIAVIIIYQICYGFATLQPSNINWLLSVRHDWGTHYLGWAFYKNEPWHFPLGKVKGYNYPVGTNVGFTDSIPLFAIFFKLFAPRLSEDFQYFGIWLFLCHLLAAYFTILLFRLFKVNAVITLLAVIFVSANPVLVYRGLHPALCGQWLLLAGIYFYFLNPVNAKPYKILLYQFIILMLSSLINPYLCWMVLGFSFATPVKLCFFDKVITWKYLLGYLLFSLFFLGLVWYITGMVELGKKEDFNIAGAYGLYSLNLNSLVNPAGYSAILPQLKQVSWHQYEGFMYLGAGMLILLFLLLFYYGVIFINRRDEKRKTLKNNFTGYKGLIPLLVLTALYAIFSITLVFTFNDKVLFRIPAPAFFVRLEEIFRASARFFWMPYYLIVLFTLIGIAKSAIKPLIASIIIIAALVIQLYDIKPLLTSRRLLYGTYTPPMDNQSWIRVMSQFDEILFFPAFESPRIRSMDYQDFSYLALKAGKPVNLAYVARADSRAMQAFSDSLTAIVETGKLSPKALYITSAANLEHFSLVFQSDAARLNTLDGCYYIFSKGVKNYALVKFVNSLNIPLKGRLDSALAAISIRREFVETDKIPAADSTPIRYHLESFHIGEKVISMQGWAFIDTTKNNKGDSIFVTLTNVDKCYMGKSAIMQRTDISGAFGALYLNDAGFKFLAFTDSVQKGRYEVGLAIKNAQGHCVYQSTGNKTSIGVPEYGMPEKITHLPDAGKIVYDLNLDVTDSVISASGWAALENQDAAESVVSLVVKNKENIYVFATEPVRRPDVSASFNNKYQLDHSGYAVKFLKKTLPSGKYQMGFLITNKSRNSENVIFTEKQLDIR